jgi:hypothetical protein
MFPFDPDESVAARDDRYVDWASDRLLI